MSRQENRRSNKRNQKKLHRNSTKRSDEKKKELKDYIYYTGSARQASDYENTTKFIINYIKGEFNYGNDIAESLRNLQYTDTEEWYPDLEVSTATDSLTNIRETKQYELKYKAKLDATVKREATFNNNKTKAYSIIWERCSKGMQSKVEQRTDFLTDIYNDPINLLQAIKEHALDYQDTKYSMEVIDDALVHFLMIKQREDPLYEYIRKFKTAKEILELHLGDPIILTKIIKTFDDYDENNLGNI